MAITLNLNVLMARWEQVNPGQKLTLRRLSDLVGVNKNTLGRLRSGTAERVDLDALDALCRFFNCAPNDLLLFSKDDTGVARLERRDSMKDKLVRDVMHRKVISCRVDAPLREVARRLDSEKINALIVVDESGDLSGVVSQTDLVKVCERDWGSMVAEDVMTSDVVTVVADIPVLAAVELMVDNQIHRVVITQGGLAPRRPVGVLSMTDVVREMAR
ncbi:MAG TPA: CBS domain-containing protein [Anaerolineae bacterium]|nr:CBS domain-containing protein [Anaerolineae bacterium]